MAKKKWPSTVSEARAWVDFLRKMGGEGLSPKRRTTLARQGHCIYPYLLRGLEIARSDQVCYSDITYVPMRRGFLYWPAVMHWHSRYVISWRLSNSLDVDFCVEALEDAFRQARDLQHGPG